MRNSKPFKDKMLKEAPWNLEDETNKMSSAMAKCIKRISKQVLGESKGKGPRSKENWCWMIKYKQ